MMQQKLRPVVPKCRVPQGFWLRRTLRAEAPGERLALAVAAAHPELGAFFSAELRARRDGRAARNERAGLATLLRRAPKRAASQGSSGSLLRATSQCHGSGLASVQCQFYMTTRWQNWAVVGILPGAQQWLFASHAGCSCWL